MNIGEVSGVTQNNLSSLISSLIIPATKNDSKNPLLTFIHQNLKYSTITKFAGSIASSKLPRSGVQGYDSSEILISTQCDMESFVAITRTASSVTVSRSLDVQSAPATTFTGSPSTRFNPSKNAFHNPSRATSSLSVDFKCLSELLLFTQIRDTTDHRTIGIKECKGKNTHLLRLLGSSCTVSINGGVNKATGNQCFLDVDCILPFQSCTPNLKNHIKSYLQSLYISEKADALEHEVPSGSDALFYRFRENYDDAQGRFLSPWKAVLFDNTCFRSSSAISTEGSTTDDSTFSIEWCQNPEVRHSTWTSDASYFGQQVLGQLTSFFPSITFFGDVTISEIHSLINNYLL